MTNSAEKKQRRFEELADADAIARAGTLTERLMKFSNLYCKEQALDPEELVFAVALYAINLRESFPAGKAAFDAVAAKAAEYYDKNA